MKQNVFDYILVILIGSILAIVTSIVGEYTEFSLGETLILLLVSEVFLIEIANYALMRHRRTRQLFQLFYKDKVLDKAINMHEKAQSEIYASWCFPRYTKNLEAYYERVHKVLTSKPSVKAHRIINIDDVGSERVKEHVNFFLDMIKTGQYSVYSSTHKAFEYIIVDGQEAILLAPDAVQEDEDIGICGKNSSFVHCLTKLSIRRCSEGNKLVLPETESIDEMMAYAHRWVDSQSTFLTENRVDKTRSHQC